MIKKDYIKYFFFIICVYILLFQNLLQSYIKFFQYFDEIIAVLSIPTLIVIMIKRENLRIKRYNAELFLLAFILFASGLYSNIRFKYQPINIAFSDALLVYKFFLTYLLSQLLFDDSFIKTYSKKINKNTKFLIIVFLLFTIANYLFKIWPSNSYRFGIMSNQVFYTYPTVLAAACIFLLSLFILTEDNNQHGIIYILITFFILISTLRFKAIGAALAIMILIIYLKKSNKTISISKLGLIGILVIVLAWDQISYYYIDVEGSARKALNETCFKIAVDYFPVGTGFATYGSYFSAVSYSPIYQEYGINVIYGLEYGNTWFVSDTFWPMIIGQFGIIGTSSYLLMLAIVFMKIQKSYLQIDKKIYISKIICLAYLAISSTSEAAFVSPIAIPLAIILGINNKVVIDEVKDEK